MQIIDTQLLNSVTAQAKESPRLRMNYNFHTQLDAPAQRLLNALEPGTVLPIHRHRNTAETYIVLQGSINVLSYNDDKTVAETMMLDPNLGNFGINIPASTWHTLEVLAPGTVIFEVKDGPYTPLAEEDILK
jgi:cupin fold WbuC family metalloprotein